MEHINCNKNNKDIKNNKEKSNKKLSMYELITKIFVLYYNRRNILFFYNNEN